MIDYFSESTKYFIFICALRMICQPATYSHEYMVFDLHKQNTRAHTFACRALLDALTFIANIISLIMELRPIYLKQILHII